MKEITILSGKGGTGKTSITAAIASLAKNAVFADNDVDAADLHLIFHPTIKETHVFEGAWVATIDEEKCIDCGICVDHCRYDAIHHKEDGFLVINPIKCEGCRLCERVCPENAITSERSINNHWYVSDSRLGPLVHAHMGPGEDNSGKLVTQVRRKAREIAKDIKSDWIINDGPPGIGCAAISSITGADAALLVTEPSKSGLHDISRLIELIHSFDMPAFAIINRYDLSENITSEIEEYLKKENIQVIAKVPFSKDITLAQIDGKTIIEYAPKSEISTMLHSAWEVICKSLS